MQATLPKATKPKKKTVFAISTKMTDADNWTEPSYFKKKSARDKCGAMNRIIGGIRTHSYDHKMTVEEFEAYEDWAD